MKKKLFFFLLAGLAACKKDTRPPSLGEAVSVEQPGGSVAQLFSQGSEIPTSATESFTTDKDNEKRLFVHILRGAGRTAKNLKSDGWWELEGVTPAKAGEARVQVTFEIDAQGQLSLSAREDEKKLAAKKLEKPGTLSPAPLTEPDDDEDTEEDPAE